MFAARVIVVTALVACGGGHGSGQEDAGPGDAGVDLDAPGIDAPPDAYVFAPDPVTMAEQLPPVVPVIEIDVGGQTIDRDVKVPGTITVYEAHDGTLTDLATRTPTLTSPIEMQGRGNFTWTLPKKGYAFQFDDATGAGIDRPLLGMPAGKDWALYACYTDKTCLRDALVYALGQRLGRWSPRTRFVELFIDGQYQGLYMVWERIRRDSMRVSIAKPAASAALGDITGGYIVRLEGGGNNVAEEFTVTQGTTYTFHYPDVSKLTAEQNQYVRSAWQALDDGTAPIDTPSWIDRGIVEEFTNNWDGYVHSIYMTKDAGGPITMGPLWDFDLAFGNGNVTGYNCNTDNWAYQILRSAPDNVPAYWLAHYEDAGFLHAWKCRYQALRQGALALSTIEAQISAWVSYTAAARGRDQATWPTIGTPIFPNCTNQPTYDAEVTWVHDWIESRLTWLDARAAEMPGTCP